MKSVGFATALAVSAACAPFMAQAQAFQEGEDQWAIAMIGAEEAYSRGYTGEGVIVGVFDSGLDVSHDDFQGQLSGLGYDWLTGGLVTGDPDGHGTHVSGIIAAALNGQGVHGVAYDATLAPYLLPQPPTADAAGLRQMDLDIGTVYGIALDQGVRIFNNSWGWDAYIGAGVDAAQVFNVMPGQIAAWRRAAELDAVLVWSTGNESQLQPNIQSGLPYYVPELQPHWLAVTAVGVTGEIASYANHCGLAAAWCLAAPGGDFPGTGQTQDDTFVISDAVGGGVRPEAGTSMAAPHVTGAVAIARQMFPEANAAGLTRMVLATAKDLGDPGVDSVYGWGLLNVGAMAQTLDADAASVFANAGWAAREGQLAVRDALFARSGEGRVWGAAIGRRSDHDASNSAFAARAETVGLVVGADVLTGDDFRLGLALAQTWTELDERDGSENLADIRATTLALTGAYEGDFLFAQGAVGVDRRDHRHVRRTIPGAAGTVLEDQLNGRTQADGDGQFAALKAGVRFSAGSLDIRPYAQITATRQTVEAMAEGGADVFSLTVEESKAVQYEAGPGVDLAFSPFAIGSADVSLTAGAAYVNVTGDDDHAVNTSLLGAPILGRVGEPGDGFRAHVAASARLAPGLTADAWIGGGAAETTDYVAAGVGVSLRF